MSARVLPREEWGRLEGRGPAHLLPLVDPASVVVVEQDGEVVAALGVMSFVHFEGAWVDPGHRSAGVVRSLLRTAFDTAGGSWVMAAAQHGDERMAEVLERLGAVKIPADLWILSPQKEEACPPQ